MPHSREPVLQAVMKRMRNQRKYARAPDGLRLSEYIIFSVNLGKRLLGVFGFRRFGEQLGKCAVEQNPAQADQKHSFGKRLDVLHVMRREYDCRAALAVEPLYKVAHREF